MRESLLLFPFSCVCTCVCMCVSISFDNNRAASGPLMVRWMGVYSATLYSYRSKDSDTSTKSNSEISQINSFSCFFLSSPFSFWVMPNTHTLCATQLSTSVISFFCLLAGLWFDFIFYYFSTGNVYGRRQFSRGTFSNEKERRQAIKQL